MISIRMLKIYLGHCLQHWKYFGGTYSLRNYLDVAGLLLNWGPLTARAPVHWSWGVTGPLSYLNHQMIHDGWREMTENKS